MPCAHGNLPVGGISVLFDYFRSLHKYVITGIEQHYHLHFRRHLHFHRPVIKGFDRCWSHPFVLPEVDVTQERPGGEKRSIQVEGGIVGIELPAVYRRLIVPAHPLTAVPDNGLVIGQLPACGQRAYLQVGEVGAADRP